MADVNPEQFKSQYLIPLKFRSTKDFKKQKQQTDNKNILNFTKFIDSSRRQNYLNEQNSSYLTVSRFTDLKGNKLQNNSFWSLCTTTDVIQRCRCQIKDNTFLIFKKNEDGNYSSLFFNVNFDTISVQVSKQINLLEKQCILIQAGKYKLYLESIYQDLLDYWFKQLSQLNQNSLGKKLKLITLQSKQEFYKIRYETQQFFLNNCETGDILLFQGNHFGAKIQRIFTNSNFDHVGMIFKDPVQGVSIFEAASNIGVSLTPWSAVIRYKWYQNIPRIVWRKLQAVKKDNNFYNTIQNFIKQTENMNYHISLMKIIQSQSLIVEPLESEEKSQSGYFCSQLIATLYKNVGLLTRNTLKDYYKPAQHFFPVDFSQKAQMKLQTGFLSAQYQICFDPQLMRVRYMII